MRDQKTGAVYPAFMTPQRKPRYYDFTKQYQTIRGYCLDLGVVVTLNTDMGFYGHIELPTIWILKEVKSMRNIQKRVNAYNDRSDKGY